MKNVRVRASVDEIDGVDVTTALAVVSEVGADLSRFPTIKHFTSWLGLCPGTKITGGKVMSSKTSGSSPARRRPCAWHPPHCAAASRLWVRTSAGCAHAWTSPRL